MNKSTALTMGACLLSASFVATAQPVEGSVEATGDGYVGSTGLVVKTGLGECLNTSMQSEDNQINICEGIEDVVEAEVVEEVVEEAEPVVEAPPEPIATIDTREFSEATLFDVDSASLNAAGRNVMTSLFGALAEYKGITGISVVGHTDSTGTEEYNQALSEQRAATVAAEIATRYPDANIEVTGMGESSPVADNETAEGRQQNRRVDINITATRMMFN